LLSERYKKLKAKYDGKGVYESPCSGWVSALEENQRENWPNLLDEALGEIKENKVSHIVLGCTHYIGLKARIQDYLGYALTFYEPTSGVMQRMKQILGENLEGSTQVLDVQLMATSSADRLEECAVNKSLKKHSVSVIDL
jgi:glutamate racemase